MSEQVPKKYQLFKVASELNVGVERLIEFCKKDLGLDVKSPASKIDEDAYQKILQKFKKEKQSAEAKDKKLAELKVKKEDKTQKPKEKKPDGFTIRTKKKVEEPEIEKEKIEEPAIEQIEVEEKPVIEPEVVQPIAQTEKLEPQEISTSEEIKTEQLQQVQETIEKAVEVTQQTTKSEEKEPPKEVIEKKEETERAHTTLDELKTQRKGPKIIGKVSITEPEEGEIPEEKVAQEVIPAEKEEKSDGKKKKPKKPKKKQLREQLKKKSVVEEEPAKAKKAKKSKIKNIDEKEIEISIRKTLEAMDESSLSLRAALRKKKKKERLEEMKKQEEILEKEKTILKVSEFVTVGELANLINVPASEIIKKLFSYGIVATINQRLEKDTIQLVADDFGYSVEFQDEAITTVIDDEPDPPETLKPRPPIVTIMGHVDHGKTSLLDYIRNTQVVAGEAGGITQHIGAYKVELPDGKQITFIDTPGHEAFTAMRARGAKVTDIVVLVVAADDAVMPQTVEAINHAQAAGVPIIVAINKIDKPTANPERIRQQLAEKNVLVEEYGGRYQSVEISAKTGKNVDLLLEKILIEAELLDLKANPNRKARGYVLEVKLEKGRGIVANVLILKGTLRINDPFVAGVGFGRVRAMFDERMNRINEAPPSTPVQILGFDEMPQAGDEFVCVESEKIAREIANKRMQIKREQELRAVRHITLEDISKSAKLGQIKDLRLIVKGDVDGSVEALSDSLLKLSNDEVKIHVIHKGVGAITETDVNLALASEAIIIGFHVRPNLEARKLAEKEKVEIKTYDIIYDAINEIKSAIAGMLEPEISEEITATVEVRDVFKISGVGTVAGCFVKDGKIQRNNKVRVVRNGITIFTGDIESLKRFKDDVREVEANKECGIKIANFNDIKVGDVIEAFKIVEKQRTLENVGKN
ncbi:MAG: translation initiation factor IF-2 [Ignavibacteria bacterium]|jgi:translation initiation factor IF-2|nr:translation initiation factor IF-2 [Ignavibacteria bacterium]MDH7527706.1 translation initiation factor IF-2 [Ignavibacteria bacterium]